MELLVALVVLGFLMLGLTTGTRLGLGAWARQFRVLAERDQLDATDRVLRHLIAHLETGQEDQQSRLYGQPDRLDFRTELPSAAALLTRRADATLFVTDRHRLVLRWRPHLHEMAVGGGADWTETTLLENVESVQLSYWEGRDVEHRAKGWHPDWDFPSPPALIRVHLDFRKGDPRHWPDVIAAPVVDPG